MRDQYLGGQGGSLAGFIIVGVLLALVLVGGLYGLNRYNAERNNAETAQEQPPAEEAPASGETPPAKETPPADTTDEASERPADPAPKRSEAAQSANLPQSGPADAVLTVLALGSLGFAATHYIRSRRAHL